MKRLLVIAAFMLLGTLAMAQGWHVISFKLRDYSISVQFAGGGEVSDPADSGILALALDGRMTPAPGEDAKSVLRRFALLRSDEIQADAGIVSESLKGEFTGSRGALRFYRFTDTFIKKAEDGTETEELKCCDYVIGKDGGISPFEEMTPEQLAASVSSRWDDGRLRSQAESLCKYIPDHGMIEDSHFFMTQDFYNTLKAAFAVPATPGEIGDEEFLYHFVSGNGGSKPVFKVLDVEMTGEDTAQARIEIRQSFDGVLTDDPAEEKLLRMRLVKGVWLLDDFDGKKAECREFISRHQ